MNIDLSVKSGFNDVRIEKVHFMSKLCQPTDGFADVVIDIAEAAEAFETKIKDCEMPVFDGYISWLLMKAVRFMTSTLKYNFTMKIQIPALKFHGSGYQ